MFGANGRLRTLLRRNTGFDPVLYVNLLYTHFLHRKADPLGLSYNVSRLAAGADPCTLLTEFATCEEAQMGSRGTKLFVAPGHFYSPVVNPTEISGRFHADAGALPSRLPGIAVDRGVHEHLWEAFVPHFAEMPFAADRREGLRYHFENPAFSYGDGLLYYAMLKHLRPRRVIEIGSGYTSALLLDVVDRFLGDAVRCTFIEPYPTLLKQLLSASDLARHTLLAQQVQDVPLDVFGQLGAGDILFIDSSHILKTCSDTNRELFDILPALKAGVHIHFHDIFYPFEYPAEWALQDNRSWNVAYALRAFLMYNPAFEISFFNDYFAKNCRDLMERDMPLWTHNTGGSLWLKKVAP